jgi:hypothetical protein
LRPAGHAKMCRRQALCGVIVSRSHARAPLVARGDCMVARGDCQNLAARGGWESRRYFLVSNTIHVRHAMQSHNSNMSNNNRKLCLKLKTHPGWPEMPLLLM